MAAAFQEGAGAGAGAGAGGVVVGGGDDDATIDVHTTRGTPIRYLPLDHLYSATSPCRVTASGSSNVMSKKIKARKLTPTHHHHFNNNSNHEHKKTTSSSPSLTIPPKPPLLFVYTRRHKRHSPSATSFCEGAENESEKRLLKKRKIGSTELERLGVDLNIAIGDVDGPRLRECRNQFGNSGAAGNAKCGSLENLPKMLPESRNVKKWVG